MFQILFIALIAIPILEIYLLFQVGGMIGAGWTILIVIGTAVLGANLLRQQGLSTWTRLNQSMAQGQLPPTILVEGILLLLSGAESLVTKKLAACVNIVNGVESVYQWRGEIKHDKEILLIIKTKKSLFLQVQNAIKEVHNYELPEIIAVPIDTGETNYLNWIKSTTLATE